MHNSILGKQVEYKSTYDSSLLFPIARQINRTEIGVPQALPFKGVDIWNGYEISWLNMQGKPEVRVAAFIFPYDSRNIIESKSFKLYLNSFNNSHFEQDALVTELMEKDLSAAAGGAVKVTLATLEDAAGESVINFSGICIDNIDVECNEYVVNRDLLQIDSTSVVHEKLYSNLLKSNCLVTGQPDWASVEVEYKGAKISQASLLKYIVSFRNHCEFHEQCVERIFMDINLKCAPQELSVYARYTRRGGLDINPYRSNVNELPSNARHVRQ